MKSKLASFLLLFPLFLAKPAKGMERTINILSHVMGRSFNLRDIFDPAAEEEFIKLPHEMQEKIKEIIRHETIISSLSRSGFQTIRLVAAAKLNNIKEAEDSLKKRALPYGIDRLCGSYSEPMEAAIQNDSPAMFNLLASYEAPIRCIAYVINAVGSSAGSGKTQVFDAVLTYYTIHPPSYYKAKDFLEIIHDAEFGLKMASLSGIDPKKIDVMKQRLNKFREVKCSFQQH